jgi:hypothetical protein
MVPRQMALCSALTDTNDWFVDCIILPGCFSEKDEDKDKPYIPVVLLGLLDK